MKNNSGSTSVAIPAMALILIAGFGCASKAPQTGYIAPDAKPSAVATAATAARPLLKVIRVDSEETVGNDDKAVNAVDDDPNTNWHTQWQDANPPYPHEIVVELTPPSVIKGFTYLPRQDESDNGTIKGYEFYVSTDGQNFGPPVSKGEFAGGKELKTVPFPPLACRFIKLKALSEINGEAWASAAEIGVVPQ